MLDATVVSLVGLSTEEIQSTIKNELNKGKADIRLVLSDDMTNDDMDAIKSALEYGSNNIVVFLTIQYYCLSLRHE